ncbi:hypothetical protein R1sor_013951 [Riccia sorocarpa]|uniref:Uncharacterized protein n=1 Tax=Riccia sorocarpa TaxID=122646 RepID=A0ABD3HB15_9MARC
MGHIARSCPAKRQPKRPQEKKAEEVEPGTGKQEKGAAKTKDPKASKEPGQKAKQPLQPVSHNIYEVLNVESEDEQEDPVEIDVTEEAMKEGQLALDLLQQATELAKAIKEAQDAETHQDSIPMEDVMKEKRDIQKPHGGRSNRTARKVSR